MRLTVSIVLSLICGGCQLSVLPPKPTPPGCGIQHFDVVDIEDNVYRGGQPTTVEQWKYIQSLGVRTILKLNTDSEGSDAEAELLGMIVVKCPITFSHQLFGPIDSFSVDSALISHPSNLYIHCEHGQDRTGLACFLLRRQQGWTKNKAQEEMLSHGFHKILHGLWEVVESNP